MQLLKDRILEDGVALGTEVLKVDSFINHQIDTGLLLEMGREFHRRFGDICPTKILTIEASGIPAAVAVAMEYGNIPVVFAKKEAPNTMVEDAYTAEIRSFTKGTVKLARVAKKYLSPDDRVLIIDDFLAHGQASTGLLNIVEQAGAKVLGIGILIEKHFQGGRTLLEKYDVPVISLAMVEKISDGEITFFAEEE